MKNQELPGIDGNDLWAFRGLVPGTNALLHAPIEHDALLVGVGRSDRYPEAKLSVEIGDGTITVSRVDEFEKPFRISYNDREKGGMVPVLGEAAVNLTITRNRNNYWVHTPDSNGRPAVTHKEGWAQFWAKLVSIAYRKQTQSSY